MNKRRIITFAMILALIAVALAIAAPLAKRKGESVQCGNCMASIGCVARWWASGHDGHLPSVLASMSNEVIATKFLICPGDHSRQPAASWATFTPADSSYEIVTPGLSDGDSNGVFLRCKVHGHLGYADATVFDGVRRRTKVP
ncbi:MAG: hypothetical protein HZA91_15825 [Verrucomicrobia bacterium]|nr:hypothetical protein [Verrucomicrobiota bacterium]